MMVVFTSKTKADQTGFEVYFPVEEQICVGVDVLSGAGQHNPRVVAAVPFPLNLHV
jgi:hypothetical protein